MAFSGENIEATDLIYPSAGHSKAPLTAAPAAGCLRIGYVCALQRARMLIEQNIGFDYKIGNWVSSRLITQTNYVRLAEGYRYLPASITHLVAEVHWHAQASSAVGTFRLVAGAGGTTNTGTAVTSDWDQTEAYRTRTGRLELALSGETSRVRMELGLTTLQTNQIVGIYVEGYVLNRSGGSAVSFMTRNVGVWSEVR